MGVLGIILGLSFIGIVKEPKGKMYKVDNDSVQVEAPKEEKIKKNLFKEIVNGLIEIVKNPTCRWVLLGTIMRTIAGISAATYLPIYFLKVYPDFKQ
jgi:hypothetical protein